MYLKTLLSATALTTVGAMAGAQQTGDITIGAGLSTFGLNFEGSYQIDPSWRARGALMGGTSAKFSESDVDDIDGDVDGDFDLGGAALLVDYYPTQSGWRISGGLFFSNTELDASGDIEIEGASDVEGTIKMAFENKISPMITTGYDLHFGDGWSFNSEIGVILSGGLDMEVEADDASLQSQIDNDEDIQDAIDDASDINALPYIALGVSYRF